MTTRKRKMWAVFCFPFYVLTFPIMCLSLIVNNHFYPEFFRGVGLAVCLTLAIIILDTLWMRLVWGKW